MAVKLINTDELATTAYANTTALDKFVVMSGANRKEVSRLNGLAKGEKDKIDETSAHYKAAQKIITDHTVKVKWDFARLTMDSAKKLIMSSQSITVGLQNSMRSALTDSQIVQLASGEVPTDDKDEPVALPGGCKLEGKEKKRLTVNIAQWLDRPSAKGNAAPSEEKLMKQFSKMDEAAQAAFLKMVQAKS